ncbi:phosphotransferase enzyme family protein [Streptomyces fulvoviolaceus]|uniref:phosphotransferase enzyme family protein n=1 Tax=Streptomyces fulvoviolaceus TaxID=285535 RepID=UPI0021C0F835|nr:aminoglycoside phosphotransferase family protein [Streptomyces fulvoviolaceus]MCT9075474.1 aminoglycoside phosphotransferase family protein [Streptomyces fulvoviolaceus]
MLHEEEFHDDEQPLSGGNVSAGVVRVGDTVRRPAGPWTPAVHALLGHLHEVGFRSVPRPLGIDERGREVLSFMPGDVIWPDRFAFVEPPERLARVARLIRDFHDAAKDFTPPADARWNVLFPVEGADLITHGDLAPWNLVVGGEDQWAFIDWDNAGPGTRLWDLAYAIHGFVPLSAHPHWQRADAADRLRVFADAYGLDEAERRDLIPLLSRRTLAMHDFLRDQAAQHKQPWATLWAEGHGDAWRNDAEYIEQRDEQWAHALLTG